MTNPRGMTSDEREEALTLLKDEELLARVQKDLTTIGVINEEKNKTLLYLMLPQERCLYSIGASSGFISKQTGDSIKTLEADYAKYIEEADTKREFVESEIKKSET
jgi:hypothetical protein